MEQGWGTPATYAECYEWFIAPYPAGGDPFSDGDPSKAPHVINNSWSCPPVEGCAAPEVLQAVVEAVRAAGIVTVHSAGNSGDNCETITAPAAIYDASFTVGATTVVTDDDGNVTGDEIADLSSRGPVTIDGNALRKPDIVAPGVGVTSVSYTHLDVYKRQCVSNVPWVARSASLPLTVVRRPVACQRPGMEPPQQRFLSLIHI